MLLIPFILVAALLVGGGLRVWQARRQYALNRALIAALINNDAKAALVLVKAGADPNTRYNPPPAPSLNLLLNQLLHRSSTADDRPTAFMLSYMYWSLSDDVSRKPVSDWDNLQLASVMLTHGADANAKSRIGFTALTVALYNRKVNIMELLLKHGANVNAPDAEGTTPLMDAAFYGYEEEVKLLLAHGANINAQDSWGNTALHHAFGKFMDKDTIKLLITHGADPNLPANDGRTPLIEAQQHESSDIVALLRKGAK